MDVSSVSSSINSALAASLQSPTRPRSAEQDQQAQQSTQTQSAQQAQAQGTTPADERQTQQAVTEAEKNRPTVNINGQTVGTLVNTTA